MINHKLSQCMAAPMLQNRFVDTGVVRLYIYNDFLCVLHPKMLTNLLRASFSEVLL